MIGDDGLDSRANDGTKHLLTAATRAAAFMDWWTMDSTNLCSTDCKKTMQLGTTVGIYAGSRQIWPSLLDGAVASARDADNPTEAELESLGMSMTGAMCSAKSTTMSSMVLAAEEYIVGGIPDLEEDRPGFIAMVTLTLTLRSYTGSLLCSCFPKV